jgi:hypothetical protein
VTCSMSCATRRCTCECAQQQGSGCAARALLWCAGVTQAGRCMVLCLCLTAACACAGLPLCAAPQLEEHRGQHAAHAARGPARADGGGHRGPGRPE